MKSRKIRLFYIFFMVLICGLAVAQPADSLRDQLRTEQRAPQRILILNKLGEAYSNINFDSSIYYFERAVVASKKLGVDSLLGQTYSRIGRVYILTGISAKGLDYLFEALKLFEKTGDNKKRIGVLNNIALVHYR